MDMDAECNTLDAPTRAAEGGCMTNWILFLLIVFVGILYRKIDVLEAKVYCIQHGIVPKEEA
jgi:hypothetical protein